MSAEGQDPLRMQTPPPIAQPPSPPAGTSLGRALAWTAATRWTSQVMAWAATILVARLLAPSDYGIVAMSTMFLGLVTLVSEFGIGSAVVALRRLADAQVRQLHTLAVLLGIFCLLFAAALAWPLALFFATPALTAVVVVSATGFAVNGIRVVPDALLQRDQRFKLLGGLEAGKGILVAIATPIMAWLGYGYWAIVLGNLLGAVVHATATLLVRRVEFNLPRIAELKEAITFSKHLLITRLAWYGYANADYLVVGKLMGQVALGFYTMAWSLANMPVEKFSVLVNRVAPSFFSAAQEDEVTMRSHLLSLSQALSLLTVPLSLGMAATADDVVLVVLGERWAGAIVPLMLLSLYASIRALATVLPSVLMVRGESRFLMRNTLAGLAVMTASFLVGVGWGTTGVAAAWLVTYPFIVVPLAARTLRSIRLPWGEYLRALWPAFASSAWMVAVVLVIRWTVGADERAVRLSASVAAGAGAYAASLFLLHPVAAERALRFARQLRPAKA